MERRLVSAVLILVLALLLANPAWAAPEGLFPSEKEMGIQTAVSPGYARYPPDRYQWDLSYRVVEWGIPPRVNSIAPEVVNGLAGQLFLLDAWLVRAGIFFIQFGFHSDILAKALGALAGAVADVKEGLSRPFLPFMLLLVGAWAAYQALVKFRVTALISGLLVAVLVFGFGYWYFGHLEEVVAGAGRAADALAQAAVGAVTAPKNRAACGQDYAGLPTADAAALAAADRIWEVLVLVPWSTGEFGRNTSPCSGGRPAAVTAAEAAALAKKKLEVPPGADWTQLLLGLPAGSEQRRDAADVLADPGLDHGDHPDTPETAGPGGTTRKLLIALAALVPAAAAAVFLGTVGLSMALAQVVLLGAVVVSPAVFLLALVPEYGFGVLRKWLTVGLGALAQKVVYGLYLGLVLLLADVLLGLEVHFALQLALTGGLFAAALLARKPLTERALQAVRVESPSQVRQEAVKGSQRAVQAELKQGGVAKIRTAGGWAAAGVQVLRGQVTGRPATEAQKLRHYATEALNLRLAAAEEAARGGAAKSDFLREVEARRAEGLSPFSEEQIARFGEAVQQYAQKEGITLDRAAKVLGHLEEDRLREVLERTAGGDGNTGVLRRLEEVRRAGRLAAAQGRAWTWRENTLRARLARGWERARRLIARRD